MNMYVCARPNCKFWPVFKYGNGFETGWRVLKYII